MTILRNVLGVGSATLVSRLLGFLRDGLLAVVLGAGPVADAFVVAQRLPNLFRRLFAEGAFGAAFVPVYMDLRGAAGAETARRFAAAAGMVLLAVVLALTGVVWIWAERVVALLAPGWGGDPAKTALAADLTRLTFPYLAAVTVAALIGGVLAADRRFLAAAAAPILLNVAMIAALVSLHVSGLDGGVLAGRVLAATITVAGLAQMLLLIAVARRHRRLPRLSGPIPWPPLRKFARTLGPGLFAGGFAEIAVVVATVIASVEPGAVSWVHYADRLYQLPLGLVGIAVGQVLLPEIAETAARRDGSVHDVQNRALEFALALTLPAAVGLFLLAEPIVGGLFRRGAFGTGDAAATSSALAVMAVGLPAAVAIRLFSAAHWGRGDTRTPMLCGVTAIVFDIALALALRPNLGWIAVAWAGSAAVWLNAVLLIGSLVRRGDWRFDALFARRLPRLFLAVVAMAVAILALEAAGLDRLTGAESADRRLLGVVVLVFAGVAVQGGLLFLLGFVDARRMIAAWRGDEPPRAEASCEPPPDRA